MSTPIGESSLRWNHGAEEGIIFIPTNLLTYLRPDGLSFSSVFPYVGLPTSPPTPVGGVLFDRLYRTSSITASMPLLFVLSLWGLVTAFRPRAVGRISLTRILLLAAGSVARRSCCGGTSLRDTWVTSYPSSSWPAQWPLPTSFAGLKAGVAHEG